MEKNIISKQNKHLFIKFFYIFQKRLFKKFSFIFILFLFLFLAITLSFTSKIKNDIFTIALYAAKENISAQNIITNLKNSTPSINFIECNNEEEAKKLTRENKCAAAWLFLDDFDDIMKEAGKEQRIKAVVTIVEAEDNPMLSFTHEILYEKVYPYFSYEAYCSYVKNTAALNVSEKRLRENYDFYLGGENLFILQNAEDENFSTENILSFPLRGILVICFMIFGFAASLYYMKDEKNNIFVWFPSGSKKFISFFSHLFLLLDAAIILLISIISTKTFTSLGKELYSIFLLTISSALFCDILCRLTKKPQLLASFLPFIFLIMIVFCPIFINLKGFHFIQFLLPPYFYLNSIYSPLYTFYFSVYTIILALVRFVLDFFTFIPPRLKRRSQTNN